MICCLSGYLMSSVFKQRNMVLYLPIRMLNPLHRSPSFLHCYKVCRTVMIDPHILRRWIVDWAREYNFCTAHNRPPEKHSITVVCLLFCINHWKNCIVWHQTYNNNNNNNNQQQQRKLIAYGRRRRIIHLASVERKKNPKGRQKLNAPKVIITYTFVHLRCGTNKSRFDSAENECTNETVWFRIRITFCQLLRPYLELYDIAYHVSMVVEDCFCHRAFSYRMLCLCMAVGAITVCSALHENTYSHTRRIYY